MQCVMPPAVIIGMWLRVIRLLATGYSLPGFPAGHFAAGIMPVWRA
jgi:hypothetical protein